MLHEIKFTSQKTQAEINREWDVIVPARDAQQRAGDVSFLQVLRPWIGAAVNGAKQILDVGCGSGRLTQTLRSAGARGARDSNGAQTASQSNDDRVAGDLDNSGETRQSETVQVVGVDPSPQSIALARASNPQETYHVGTLESFAAKNPSQRFDLAVANMVLMDAPDLDGLLKGVARLTRGGRFVATIAHPAFWPLYLGYAGKETFSYGNETFVEAPYVVNNRSFNSATTHIHRPVSRYISAFTQAGMAITRMEELRGTEPRSVFPFPRFLAIEARVDS
ncbi:MAG TPA: class I SAM-dependent methyltransferase [Actinomycetales bacterium]|nr:class I SAM-dependent methyltransferase [Actinomycetales bacterium]